MSIDRDRNKVNLIIGFIFLVIFVILLVFTVVLIHASFWASESDTAIYLPIFNMGSVF